MDKCTHSELIARAETVENLSRLCTKRVPDEKEIAEKTDIVSCSVVGAQDEDGSSGWHNVFAELGGICRKRDLIFYLCTEANRGGSSFSGFVIRCHFIL
jgi:hypothetical protein